MNAWVGLRLLPGRTRAIVSTGDGIPPRVTNRPRG